MANPRNGEIQPPRKGLSAPATTVLMRGEAGRIPALRPTRDHCRCSPAPGGCGEYFNSTYAFERNRTGRHGLDRRCRVVAEMEARGFVKNARGFWITRTSPMALARRERRRSAAFEPDPLPDYLPRGTTAFLGAR